MCLFSIFLSFLFFLMTTLSVPGHHHGGLGQQVDDLSLSNDEPSEMEVRYITQKMTGTEEELDTQVQKLETRLEELKMKRDKF